MSGDSDPEREDELSESEVMAKLAANLQETSDALPSDIDFDVDALAAEIVDEAVELSKEPDTESIRQEIEVLLADLEGRLEELESRLERLEREQPPFELELDHVTDRFEKFRDELSNIRYRIRRIRRRTLAHESDSGTPSEELVTDYETAVDEHRRLHIQLDNLANRLDSLEDWLDNIGHRVDGVATDVEDIETNIHRVSTALEEFEVALQSDSTSVPDAIDRTFWDDVDSIETASRDIRETLEEFEEWTERAEGTYPNVESRIRDLHHRLDEVRDTCVSSIETLERLRQEYFDDRVADLRAEHTALRDRIAELEDGLADVDKGFAHVKERFHSIYEQLDDIDGEIDELSYTVEQRFQVEGESNGRGLWEWRREVFGPRLDTTESLLINLNSDIDEFEQWLLDVDVRIDSLASRIEELDADIESNRRQVRSFEEELDTTTASFTELQFRHEQLTDTHRDLRDRLNRLKRFHGELVERDQATETTNSSVTSQLNDLDRHLINLATVSEEVGEQLTRIRDDYLEDIDWHIKRLERRCEAKEDVLVEARAGLSELQEIRTDQSATFDEAGRVIIEVDDRIDEDLPDERVLEHFEELPGHAGGSGRVKTEPNEAYVQKFDAIELDVGTAMTVVASLSSAAIADDLVASGTFIIGMFGALYEQTKTQILPIDGFVYWVGYNTSDDDQIRREELANSVDEHREEIGDRIEMTELDLDATLARLERNGCIERDKTDDGEQIEFKMRCKSTWNS